jgi:FkbM family methyltransferase
VAERPEELYADLRAGRRPDAAPPTSSLEQAAAGAGSSRPLRVASARAQRLPPRTDERSPRAFGAAAVIKPAVLPDGRRLAFVVDPEAQEDPLARTVLERGYPGDLACELALHLLDAGQTLVDVGAGLGTVSLAAAASGCRVLALEPSTANVRLLRTAVTYNGFESVTVVHGTAGATPGSEAPRDNGSRRRITAQNGRVGGAGRGDEARAYRIDDLLQQHAIDGVDLIKLAIGGGVVAALAGLERTFSQLPPPALIVESNAPALGARGETVAELKRAVVALGYSIFLLGRRDPGLLTPVTASDLQGEAIAEYVAFKGDAPAAIAPWRIGQPFDDRQLVECLRAETEAQERTRRRYAASVLRVAPRAVAEDPLMRAAVAGLRRSGDPKLERILDGHEPVARYGLAEQLEHDEALR